jgi:drug/metabolite transporter (DMT)-like permease
VTGSAARAISQSAANRALAGIGLLVAAVACFAVLDTTTKFISLSVPALMALWFRYAFQAIATTVAVLPKRGWALLRTAHPKFQLLRGVLLLTTSLLAFFSLKYMPVGEFTAIVMITPLLITLLASITLGERVSALRWTLVVGGFAGTLVIIRPGGEGFDWAMLLPLGLVVSHAWFQILTSRLARTEDPFTMHFYTGWVGTLVASVALPFVWAPLDSWMLWGGLFMMGLMGTVGHFMMILAYARAPVSTLTPFLYAQIGFAMLGGWLAFSHVPDHLSMLGMGMIAVCGAAGAWLAVRESRVTIQPPES